MTKDPMSDLPEIDYQQVSRKLAEDLGTEVSNLKFQLRQMESLVLAVQAERDEARRHLADLQAAIAKPDESDTNPDGTDSSESVTP